MTMAIRLCPSAPTPAEPTNSGLARVRSAHARARVGWSRMRQTWLEQVTSIAERGREILSRTPAARRPETTEALCDRLLAQRGEALGIALASELVSAIQAMDEDQTGRFANM